MEGLFDGDDKEYVDAEWYMGSEIPRLGGPEHPVTATNPTDGRPDYDDDQPPEMDDDGLVPIDEGGGYYRSKSSEISTQGSSADTHIMPALIADELEGERRGHHGAHGTEASQSAFDWLAGADRPRPEESEEAPLFVDPLVLLRRAALLKQAAELPVILAGFEQGREAVDEMREQEAAIAAEPTPIADEVAASFEPTPIADEVAATVFEAAPEPTPPAADMPARHVVDLTVTPADPASHHAVQPPVRQQPMPSVEDRRAQTASEQADPIRSATPPLDTDAAAELAQRRATGGSLVDPHYSPVNDETLERVLEGLRRPDLHLRSADLERRRAAAEREGLVEPVDHVRGVFGDVEGVDEELRKRRGRGDLDAENGEPPQQ